MAVSNQYIPSVSYFQYIKYRWFKDAFWICPQTTAWTYGWWYIAVVPDLPRVEHVSFRLSWSTKDIDTCRQPPPPLVVPTAGDDWTLLQDNIPFVGWFAPTNWTYFRFYVNSTCTDFGVSARPQTPYSTIADFDLFVSFTDPHPRTEKAGRNDFASDTEHDDFLSFKQLCNPDGNATTVFYIGVWNWEGAGAFLFFTASQPSPRKARSD
jgi:hypothetical protein